MDANITTAAMQQISSIDLLQKVDAFYNGAWNRLLIFITIGGLLVPFLIQLYQKRVFDFETKKLDEQFAQEQGKLKAQFLEYQTATEIELANVTAGIYHVQTLHMIAQQNYVGAIKSVLDSMPSYIKSDNRRTFKRLLNMLIDCINTASAQDIKDVEEDDYDIDLQLTRLQERDRDKYFSDEILGIKRALKTTRAKI